MIASWLFKLCFTWIRIHQKKRLIRIQTKRHSSPTWIRILKNYMESDKVCTIKVVSKHHLKFSRIYTLLYMINCAVFGNVTSHLFTIMAVNSSKTHSSLRTGLSSYSGPLMKHIPDPYETYPWPGLFKAKIILRKLSLIQEDTRHRRSMHYLRRLYWWRKYVRSSSLSHRMDLARLVTPNFRILSINK